MEYILAGVLTGLLVIAVITSVRKARREEAAEEAEYRERKRSEMFREHREYLKRFFEEKARSEQESFQEDRLHTLEDKISLVLDHLGLEFKVEPPVDAKPMLVKKSKERGQ